MDRRHFASPHPTLPIIHDRHDGSSPRRRTSNDRFSSGSGRSILAGSMGMAIPGKGRPPSPPPPLPPPRFAPMEGDAAGSDPGWAPAWGSDPSGGFGVRPLNHACPKSWVRQPNANSAPEQAMSRARQTSSTTAKAPEDIDRARASSKVDEGYWSLPASTSGTQHLPGERQLHHRDQAKSSQTYDNKLLSKLGKPNTPPRKDSVGSAENSPSSTLTFGRQPLPPQLRSLSFSHSVASGNSDPPVKREPDSRSGESPISQPISPSTTLSSATAGRQCPGYRSPTLSTRSSTLDPETHSPYSQRFPPSIDDTLRPPKTRRSIGGSLLSDVDESAVSNTATLSTRLVKKENYDQSVFSELESTFRMEDHVEQLHLDDRTSHRTQRDLAPRYSHAHHQALSSDPMSGTSDRKRKMAQMASQDDANAQYLKETASTANDFQQSVPTHLSPSHFAQHQGPLSSQSSMGFRNGSYTSSAAPANVADSYPSFGHQSGGVSPSDQQQQQQPYPPHIPHDLNPYADAPFLDPDAQNLHSGPYPKSQQQHDPADSKPPPRKTNAEPARRGNVSDNMPTSATFICSCCPKKPRKFDNLDDRLRHEAEKQYGCGFCSNRFKNKNEMERHQNSLHLRRSSWSCAELARDYTRAFFPSSELPPPTNVPGQSLPPPSTLDTCGYCGQEFANDPPDWDDRMRHLDTVHKYRECTHSKKFFRADHFRQHLKHSHGGNSGKWTNRLEQACINQEPPAQPHTTNDDTSLNSSAPSAPVANMGSMHPAEMGQPSLESGPVHNDISQPGMAQQHFLSQVGVGQSSASQIDLSNIDPNIAFQSMTPGPMGNMGPPASHSGIQQLAQQAGLNYEDMKEPI